LPTILFATRSGKKTEAREDARCFQLSFPKVKPCAQLLPMFFLQPNDKLFLRALRKKAGTFQSRLSQKELHF
jgi:hypothetical protein